MRRATFTDAAVNYGAIGGTLAPDLLRYPPAGYRPIEKKIRLGSGDERFQTATDLMMTWGIHRGADIEISDISAGTGRQYVGLSFDAHGTPIPEQPEHLSEQKFSADGTPYISAGMTAMQKIRYLGLTFEAPIRIVFVIEETDRVGFGAGTLPGHPLSGEESFIVERRDDGSVWLTIRILARPATWYYRLGGPIVRRAQKLYVSRFLRALHPVAAA